MIVKKRLRILWLVATLMIFAAVSAFYLNKEKSYCMGVPVIDEAQLASMGENVQTDISGIIMFGGYPAAIDKENYTIYISQKIDENTLYTDLEHNFTAEDYRYKMYFVEDKNLYDIYNAVKNGYPFRLILSKNGQKEYVQYNVVLTTLPVVNVTGEFSHIKDGDGRNVYAGDITVWDCFNGSTQSYRVQNSPLEWNRRGQSTFDAEKKPIKLSLKNSEGEKSNLDLAGLGQSDDDWILNSMPKEKSRIREMLCMDLWNQLYETTSAYNYKMSTGIYTEVVMNGSYYGLYMLQRRIDAKYLGLDSDDVLLKGYKGTDVEEIYHNFEIAESVYEEEAVNSFIADIYERGDVSPIQLKNWMDVNLFTVFGNMKDNMAYHNCFYIIRDFDTYPKMSFVLWDTDISFGIRNDQKTQPRLEMELLKKQYPDIDRMLAERWFELRDSVLSKDNICAVIEKNSAVINEAASLARDYHRWDEDIDNRAKESVCEFVDNRLELLDKYYGEILN